MKGPMKSGELYWANWCLRSMTGLSDLAGNSAPVLIRQRLRVPQALWLLCCLQNQRVESRQIFPGLGHQQRGVRRVSMLQERLFRVLFYPARGRSQVRFFKTRRKRHESAHDSRRWADPGMIVVGPFVARRSRTRRTAHEARPTRLLRELRIFGFDQITERL